MKKAVLEKVETTKNRPSEIREILGKLDNVRVSDKGDFALGIAVGRIFNSFHYQTRRILKRNATDAEFEEFLEILMGNLTAIRAALDRQ